MNKKDVLELKRRLKKEYCTFTRMCGCYVDIDGTKITKIEETFLNLEDEEFYKYLDIAKKVLSGSIGNNLLELKFPAEEEAAGGRQQILMGLRESKLKNEKLLDNFYDQIIYEYDYVGKYLILIFHDAYDVIKKSSDNNSLDESEEVYEYLLCAICPVELSKAALSYEETENRIAPRIRDWVVKVPDTGFIFPAFTDRSTDIHSAMFYTRNAKCPHREVEENVLGCSWRMTSLQKQETFSQIIRDIVGDGDKEKIIYNEIQDMLCEQIPEKDMGAEPDDKDRKTLTTDVVTDIVKTVGLPSEQVALVRKNYELLIPEDTKVDEVIDKKSVREYGQEKYIMKLTGLLQKAAGMLKSYWEIDIVQEIEKNLKDQ